MHELRTRDGVPQKEQRRSRARSAMAGQLRCHPSLDAWARERAASRPFVALGYAHVVKQQVPVEKCGNTWHLCVRIASNSTWRKPFRSPPLRTHAIGSFDEEKPRLKAFQHISLNLRGLVATTTIIRRHA